jgi:hypothetical protein
MSSSTTWCELVIWCSIEWGFEAVKVKVATGRMRVVVPVKGRGQKGRFASIGALQAEHGGCGPGDLLEVLWEKQANWESLKPFQRPDPTLIFHYANACQHSQPKLQAENPKVA